MCTHHTAEETQEATRLYYQLLGRLQSHGFIYAKHGVEDASRKAILKRGLTAARIITLSGFTTGFDSADTITASNLASASQEYREALFAGAYARKKAAREPDLLDEWTQFVGELRKQANRLTKRTANRLYDTLEGQA